MSMSVPQWRCSITMNKAFVQRRFSVVAFQHCLWRASTSYSATALVAAAAEKDAVMERQMDAVMEKQLDEAAMQEADRERLEAVSSVSCMCGSVVSAYYSHSISNACRNRVVSWMRRRRMVGVICAQSESTWMGSTFELRRLFRWVQLEKAVCRSS